MQIKQKEQAKSQLQTTDEAVMKTARLVDVTHRRQLQQMQKSMRKEERMGRRVDEKLRLYRQTFEAGDWDDPDSEVTFWKEQYQTLAEELGPDLVRKLAEEQDEEQESVGHSTDY